MNGKYKAIWLNDNGDLEVLDQRTLPHEEKIITLTNAQESIDAIKDMTIRGAGVIGCVAAFGVYLAARECNGSFDCMKKHAFDIRESRPTAVNLMWAVDRMLGSLDNSTNIIEDSKTEAIAISDEDAMRSVKIGQYGCEIIENILKIKSRKRINILTHCNAGWLAILDEGSALAPIYEAKRRGIDIHVYVDETRPRNQGANLTSWELFRSEIEHTIIADNTGGHLMQHGEIDMVITGADRVSRRGDVANKIGTYLKALAANDNNIPFYVALPASTFDFDIIDGIKEIEIEERSENEVHFMRGVLENGDVTEVRITPKGSKALNIGFDVTPNRLITGLITERGVCKATQIDIEKIFSLKSK